MPANGTVKLFVNRGKRGGISEEDLSWALREGAVLPKEAIHSIRVLDRFSFVEVAADQAERAVEYLDGTKLKGKQIRMEIARSEAQPTVSSSILPIRSSHSNGFGMKSVAPSERIRSGSWASRCAEIISTGMLEPSPRISSRTSVPDLLGIIASSRITSGSLGPPRAADRAPRRRRSP